MEALVLFGIMVVMEGAREGVERLEDLLSGGVEVGVGRVPLLWCGVCLGKRE